MSNVYLTNNNRTIEIEDAKLLPGGFMNFSGKVDKYNQNGNRYVNFEIPEEAVDELKDLGYHVKMLKPRNEDDNPLYYLKAYVSYRYYAPKITTITSTTRTELTEETVGTLDKATILSADVVLNASRNDQGLTCYVDEMWIKIAESRFAAKYRVEDDEGYYEDNIF